MPSPVRAHAFVTLGKLCLRDAGLAKSCMTVLARELHSPTSPGSVRSNVLVVMSDLCVRFTGLVDRYLPNMAASLRDRDLVVRRHALLLLTQLLQQDFLKWRGDMLYRFMGALSDTDETMRVEAEYALGEVFLVRDPSLYLHHFVDAVYVLVGSAVRRRINTVFSVAKCGEIFTLVNEKNYTA